MKRVRSVSTFRVVLYTYFSNDTQVGGATACWQGIVADKVHCVCPRRRVREITLGETADVVGRGMDPGGGVGAGAERSCSYYREVLDAGSTTVLAL